jgi:hypothetical protein
VRALVPLDFQVEQRLVPFRLEREGRSERLHVAVDDPSDLTHVDELSFQLNKPIRVHVAAEDDLDQALELVSGRVVDGLALEGDDDAAPMELEHGSRVPDALPVTPRVDLSVLDWEPQAPQASAVDDGAPLSPARSALKPKPPAPPPFSDDDDSITLITPKHAQKGRASTPPPPPPPQESEEVLDELLGEPDDEQTPLPSTPPPSNKKGGVPVVVFGGAAKGAPQPTPRPELPDISEDDLKVLEDIERMADGAEAELHTEKVKPARMVASLIRLLIRKRLIREEEFLEELSRK